MENRLHPFERVKVYFLLEREKKHCDSVIGPKRSTHLLHGLQAYPTKIKDVAKKFLFEGLLISRPFLFYVFIF